MKLVRLGIQQLPGIRPGFELEGVDPAINLIVGPNASGKSSLVRALRYLVAGRNRDDPPALSLEAELEGRTGRWLVIRTGTQVVWQRDGAAAEAPPLPDPRFFHCYWLAAEDLLRSEHEGDHEIALRLRRELTGGYDVDGLLGPDGPFRVGARHGGRESGALREARRGVRQVAEAYQGLQRQRERLPDLERGIEEGARIPERIERTTRALDLLAARRERIRAEAALAEFPATAEEMARLQGDEAERLDKLTARREELDKKRGEWRGKRSDAEVAIKETGLEEEAPDSEDLELHSKNLQKARELLRDRTAELENGRRAIGEERVAAERLGVPDGRRPALDPGTVSEAETLAVELEGVRKTIQELEARLSGATDSLDPAGLEANREAAAALRAWLAGPANHTERLWIPGLVVLAASAVAVTALIAGWSGVSLGAAIVAGVAAAAVAALSWMIREQRTSARDRFSKQGVEAPQRWTVSEVIVRLEEIEARIVELREAEARSLRVEADGERLKSARERFQELDARKRALALQVGFEPDCTAASLHEFVRLVDRLHEWRVRGESAKEAVAEIDTRIGEHVRIVRSFLAQWDSISREDGGSSEEDASELPGDWKIIVDALEAALTRLTRRCTQADSARGTIGRANEEIEELDTERDRLSVEEREVYERAGLEPGARGILNQRLEALEAFRQREGKLREARIAEAQLRSGMEGEEELLAWVESDDEAALRANLDELRARAEEVERLKEERTAIVTRIQEAGADRKLEEAMAASEQARTALEEALEATLLAEAGQFLLEGVKEEHRTEHEPTVLRDARERFERFTQHQWTLDLQDGGIFGAFDQRMGERRSLSQLSSGTRMQLLLAVRVAWTRILEEDREPLPLFLDEALTTSDPDRFSLIAKSLASLADEEGRQIFYLCAQPTDVQLWERALGKTPRIIDLAQVRFGLPSDMGAHDFTLPEREQIPEPDGAAREAYAARLGVPPIDPWEDPGAIHVFHLLRDDLPRVHRLMSDWGLLTQGQVELLLDSAAAEHAVPDPDARRRVGARCRVSRLWVDAWRAGRSRLIDRSTLEQSGAVSDTFIDRVSDLLGEVDGDPTALLHRLPGIPRFWRSKIEELETWLVEQGYLSLDEPLEPVEREARVLQDAAGLLEPGEVREVVRWLEAGTGGSSTASDEEAGK